MDSRYDELAKAVSDLEKTTGRVKVSQSKDDDDQENLKARARAMLEMMQECRDLDQAFHGLKDYVESVYPERVMENWGDWNRIVELYINTIQLKVKDRLPIIRALFVVTQKFCSKRFKLGKNELLFSKLVEHGMEQMSQVRTPKSKVH